MLPMSCILSILVSTSDLALPAFASPAAACLSLPFAVI